jgi:hypothetical protein
MKYLSLRIFLVLIALIVCACTTGNDNGGGDDDDTADDDIVDDDTIDDDVSADDDTTADDDADDDDSSFDPFSYDFSAYPIGEPPPGPWWSVETYGSTTIQVVETPYPDLFFSPHEHVLEINGGYGGVGMGDSGVTAALFPDDVAGDILVSAVFAVDNAHGLIFTVDGKQPHEFLQLVIFEKKIMAWDSRNGGHNLQCATIAPATREQIEISIAVSGLYDVRLNNEATNCVGMHSGISFNDGYSGFKIIDGNGTDEGGVAYFDFFQVESWHYYSSGDALLNRITSSPGEPSFQLL